jgi:hypothetical protein
MYTISHSIVRGKFYQKPQIALWWYIIVKAVSKICTRVLSTCSPGQMSKLALVIWSCIKSEPNWRWGHTYSRVWPEIRLYSLHHNILILRRVCPSKRISVIATNQVIGGKFPSHLRTPKLARGKRPIFWPVPRRSWWQQSNRTETEQIIFCLDSLDCRGNYHGNQFRSPYDPLGTRRYNSYFCLGEIEGLRPWWMQEWCTCVRMSNEGLEWCISFVSYVKCYRRVEK